MLTIDPLQISEDETISKFSQLMSLWSSSNNLQSILSLPFFATIDSITEIDSRLKNNPN